MAVRNSEWLNSNENRAYPFAEEATLKSGPVVLPKDFLLDAILSGCSEQLLYKVNYIDVAYDLIQFGINDSAGTFVGVVNIDPVTTIKYTSLFLNPDADIKIRGRFVFGDGVTTVLETFPLGRTYFGFGATTLESSVCVPEPEGRDVVTTLAKFGDPASKMFGDVKLREGDNIKITPIIGLNTFAFEGLRVFNCDCPEDIEKLSRCGFCIKSINGIRPREDDGNFDIRGSGFITVTEDPGNNAIEISFNGDVECCCESCEELDDIRARLEAILAAIP